ncbi:MAG TPA: ABC transporter ATP-binding protein [Actinocrinis sp.]|jgi:NitT/TauT family transport system ATP-binding protein
MSRSKAPARPAATATRGATVAIKDVCVEYDTARSGVQEALKDINLTLGSGEFVCVVGTSGCGKTTLLKAIDGLVPTTSGSIELDGRLITKPDRTRSVVFQSASLLPWRTVEDNVRFGLEMHGRHRTPEARRHVRDLIELVGLGGFESSYPGELSGGMQQRVNLARALAVDPELLLLDEPFAALDAQTREIMQGELLKIWEATHKTALFITHQIDEAVYLADRVVVMTARPGRIRDVITVDIPRPRPLQIKRDPHFVEYVDRVWNLIEEEGRLAARREHGVLRDSG